MGGENIYFHQLTGNMTVKGKMWHPIKILIPYTVVMLNFEALPTLLVEDTNQCNKETWTLDNGTSSIPDTTDITSDHLLNIKKSISDKYGK
jgi:hypothetical protein